MAYSFVVNVKGQKQGQFKSENPKKIGGIVGLAFAYGVKKPIDVATGEPTGKRQHSPIRVVKEWGASSPQFFEALVTNEALPEVTLEFRKTNPAGEEYVYQRIKLTDAGVCEIRQFTNEDAADASAKRAPSEREEISFTFHKIEIENTDGKTIADDDWGNSS